MPRSTSARLRGQRLFHEAGLAGLGSGDEQVDVGVGGGSRWRRRSHCHPPGFQREQRRWRGPQFSSQGCRGVGDHVVDRGHLGTGYLAGRSARRACAQSARSPARRCEPGSRSGPRQRGVPKSTPPGRCVSPRGTRLRGRWPDTEPPPRCGGRSARCAWGIPPGSPAPRPRPGRPGRGYTAPRYTPAFRRPVGTRRRPRPRRRLDEPTRGRARWPGRGRTSRRGGAPAHTGVAGVDEGAGGLGHRRARHGGPCRRWDCATGRRMVEKMSR